MPFTPGYHLWPPSGTGTLAWAARILPVNVSGVLPVNAGTDWYTLVRWYRRPKFFIYTNKVYQRANWYRLVHAGTDWYSWCTLVHWYKRPKSFIYINKVYQWPYWYTDTVEAAFWGGLVSLPGYFYFVIIVAAFGIVDLYHRGEIILV
jgi:hypothetical protein